MDQMNKLVSKYLASNVKKVTEKAPISKIFPVQIDFPLPNSVIGSEKRLNKGTSFNIPEITIKKNKPEFLIGQNTRIHQINEHQEQYLDKVVSVVGWARETRLQANDSLLFIKLVDGSSTKPLQIVIQKSVPNWQEVKKAKMHYSFKITGKMVKSEGKGQLIEMKLTGEAFEEIKIFGKNQDDKYPLSGKKITLETLRDIAHLRPRTQIMSAIARVKNNIAYATHQFFQNNGFLYIHTPLITCADCEGAGQMFQVTTVLPSSGLVKDIPQIDGKIDYGKQFFKKTANLTVSGQLAVQNFCCALSNVYTFGPTFRAEVSHTSRHMAEFWMIEPQLAFADVYDCMDCAEAYVQYCIKFVLENNRDDLVFLETKKPGLQDYLQRLINGPFARCSYTQAIQILLKVIHKGVVFQNQVYWGIDMSSQHEKYLCDHVFHKPVIVYNYPSKIKAFYMRENQDDKTVASFDILAPQVGEIVGGSQREERLEVLEAKLDKLGLPKENYWWYLELRRFGTVPHGGFGLGFERLVMMVTGIENIRDVACFPRTPGNAEF